MKYDTVVQEIIKIFKTKKTDFVELIATLFACWEEILNNKKPYSDKLLIKKFYEWSEKKIKFDEKDVIIAIEWMHKKSFTPNSLSS